MTAPASGVKCTLSANRARKLSCTPSKAEATPGRAVRSTCVFLVGKASHNLDATQAIWDFFKRRGL